MTRGPARPFPTTEAFQASACEARHRRRHAAWPTATSSDPGSLAEVERELTELHAAAVEQFLRAAWPTGAADIDVVGFHGHTVLHAPRAAAPDGAARRRRRCWPRRTGIDVVYDLRAADCAAGGQGAPLAPVYHRALAARLPQRPIAILNIGGVANVTWIGRDGELLAFDTGPGNAMIDDWMQRRRGAARDEDGALGGHGPRARRLRHAVSAAFLLRRAAAEVARPQCLLAWSWSTRLSPEDGAATLTAFTAASIARAREHFPEQPQLWVISGGGRRNKTLMAMIAGRVEAAVAPAEAAGMDGDAVEAEAWAYLAVRSLQGPADHLPRHHRRAAAAHGRRAGAGVTVVIPAPCRPGSQRRSGRRSATEALRGPGRDDAHPRMTTQLAARARLLHLDGALSR